MKQKSKLEKSRFILYVITLSIMLLHIVSILLVITFTGAIAVVGFFYLPVFAIYFTGLLVPVEKISKLEKLGKSLSITAISFAVVITLTLLFFASAGAFLVNANFHGSPVASLPVSVFTAFIITTFSIVGALILISALFTIISIILCNKLSSKKGEHKNEN